jgi:hypothetical protein
MEGTKGQKKRKTTNPLKLLTKEEKKEKKDSIAWGKERHCELLN